MLWTVTTVPHFHRHHAATPPHHLIPTRTLLAVPESNPVQHTTQSCSCTIIIRPVTTPTCYTTLHYTTRIYGTQKKTQLVPASTLTYTVHVLFHWHCAVPCRAVPYSIPHTPAHSLSNHKERIKQTRKTTYSHETSPHKHKQPPSPSIPPPPPTTTTKPLKPLKP